ncbi:hypothetical protein VP424E501_P0086 [Vibrio phage 424E50-1]|nr:hypothetical protein VP424E501_P0086 [Vibrio phage 424E50-1]
MAAIMIGIGYFYLCRGGREVLSKVGEIFEITGTKLTVVGRYKEKGKPLKYIFNCEVCSKDIELFPYGSIKTIYMLM